MIGELDHGSFSFSGGLGARLGSVELDAWEGFYDRLTCVCMFVCDRF